MVEQSEMNETITELYNVLKSSKVMTINGQNVNILQYINAKKDSFVFDDRENMLMFIIPNRKKIIIYYNKGTDTYNVDLYDLAKWQYIKQLKDIYVNQLIDIIKELATTTITKENRKQEQQNIKTVISLLRKQKQEVKQEYKNYTFDKTYLQYLEKKEAKIDHSIDSLKKRLSEFNNEKI